MDFFKIRILLLVAICSYGCAFLTIMRIKRYEDLSQEELLDMCQKENITEQNFQGPQEKILNYFMSLISESASPDGNKCISPDIREQFQLQMSTVKKCISEGHVSLSNKDIKDLEKQTEKKFCSLAKLSWFEGQISHCFDYEAAAECENNITKKKPLENPDAFANLGLSYSPHGAKEWKKMLQCTSSEYIMNENCTSDMQKEHSKLTKNFLNSMVIRK